jgi:hypothetical protein
MRLFRSGHTLSTPSWQVANNVLVGYPNIWREFPAQKPAGKGGFSIVDERALCPSEVTGNRACGVAPEQTFGSASEERSVLCQRVRQERQRVPGIPPGESKLRIGYPPTARPLPYQDAN